jgi:hypothetical protein
VIFYRIEATAIYVYRSFKRRKIRGNGWIDWPIETRLSVSHASAHVLT